MAAETSVLTFVPVAVKFDFGSVFGFALEFELFEAVVAAAAVPLFDFVFDFAAVSSVATSVVDSYNEFLLLLQQQLLQHSRIASERKKLA